MPTRWTQFRLKALKVAQVLVAIAAIAVSTDPYVSSPLVTGDLYVWDRIFASRSPRVLLDGPPNGLIWTEGPLIVGSELVFTDPVAAKLHSFDLDAIASTEGTKRPNEHLRLLKERSGDCPPEDDFWRAEPGANGLALIPNNAVGGDDENLSTTSTVVACQHGARRIAIMDLSTGQTKPLATEYNGMRLNGPNDVCIRSERVQEIQKGNNDSYKSDRTYAYFTDPVYGWLEKDRFEDLPYLDEKVKSDGPGHCGVYRVELKSGGKVELVTSKMKRPNGIAFDEDDLIVSDCCQGSHLENCKSGISRWEILIQRVSSTNTDGGGSSSWVHSATIVDEVSANQAEGGCADGFAVYNLDYDVQSSTGGQRERRKMHMLLASCFGGFCVVDLEDREIVARMWTAKKEYGGCRISNVAVGSKNVYLTGSCGVWMLPLRVESNRESSSSNQNDDLSLHGEL